jgi:hypothetical protein
MDPINPRPPFRNPTLLRAITEQCLWLSNAHTAEPAGGTVDGSVPYSSYCHLRQGTFRFPC